MASAVAAGHLERGDAGVVRERRRGRKPARSSGPSEQPGHHDRADAVHLGQPTAVLGDGLGHQRGELLQSGVDLADLADEFAGQVLAGALHRAHRAHRAHPGQDPSGLRGGQVGVRATGHRVAQHRVQLIDRRVRCATRFAQPSSSTASAVERSSTATGWPSPPRTATPAAAAASITSFLRRPPRDDSRTRAVAVHGTSSTCSPRTTSHCARCRPRLRAFPTAHRRLSNQDAHRSSCRYRPTTRRSAPTPAPGECPDPMCSRCGPACADRYR